MNAKSFQNKFQKLSAIFLGLTVIPGLLFAVYYSHYYSKAIDKETFKTASEFNINTTISSKINQVKKGFEVLAKIENKSLIKKKTSLMDFNLISYKIFKQLLR